MSTFILLFSQKSFELSSESDLLILDPYSFLFLKNHLSPYNSLQKS